MATLPRLAPRSDGPAVEADLTFPATWRGWGWPENITVKWKAPDDPAVVCTLKGEMTTEGPVLTSVSLVGANLRPSHLRLPFHSVLRGAFATAALGPRDGGGYSRREGVVVRVPVGTGRPIDVTSARQRLEEVAAVYKKATRGTLGHSVAAHFSVSEGYARKLIAEARKAGLIE